jgi:anti-sigma regulatory factor (Ser/Thr protein kinase)
MENPPETIVVRLESTAELILLRPLDLFIRCLMEQIPVLSRTVELVDNLELVFTEAYANVHRHAYKSGEKGPVVIEIRITPCELAFIFEDFGEGFEPSQVQTPDLDAPSEGGLGVWLMKHYMDEYHYTRNNAGKNILKLVKKLTLDIGP